MGLQIHLCEVKRYIRLTCLIPEILQMVDEKKIALTPAVELSYLTESEQRDLLETMESEDLIIRSVLDIEFVYHGTISIG